MINSFRIHAKGILKNLFKIEIRTLNSFTYVKRSPRPPEVHALTYFAFCFMGTCALVDIYVYICVWKDCHGTYSLSNFFLLLLYITITSIKKKKKQKKSNQYMYYALLFHTISRWLNMIAWWASELKHLYGQINWKYSIQIWNIFGRTDLIWKT